MRGGTRMATWKERENNKCRERRRRAVAAKIFAGLRLYGNYTLPKHCDNNEVLKALCNEAGWTVHPDGTTYRKGCKAVGNLDIMGGSASASACSSYQQGPFTLHNPGPVNGTSLTPWLKNLSSSTPPPLSSMFISYNGSVSAPVTSPSSSPTVRTPRINPVSGGSFAHLGWGGPRYPFLPLSTPPSPGHHHILPNSEWYFGTQVPQSESISPTFSLVSSKPFGSRVEDLTQQSGTCSPALADIPMSQVIPNEFAFGSNTTNLVKPWEGETIHAECGSDDLELTLGSSKSR